MSAAGSRAATSRTDLAVVVLWAFLVAVAVGYGTARVAHAGVSLRAAPLMGRWDWHAGRGLVPAALAGGAVALWGPRLARQLTWRAVPPVAGLAAAGWATALGAGGGWDRLTAPLTTRHEYEPLAARIGDLGPFLDSYVARLGERPIHVQGHPPGPVVVAWALDRVGLGGAGWLAVLAVAAWGGAVAAALVAARAVAGEAAARRAAPALVVLPAAVWAATSLDALYAGIGAAGVALAVVAATRASPAWALAAGSVLGAGLLCSYGAVLLLLVAAAALVAVAYRPVVAARAVVLMAVGGAVVLGMGAVAGFWWPDGLAATHRAYWAGVGAERPGLYLTLVGNPAALALAIGPAVAVGLAKTLAAVPATRRRRAPRGRATRPGIPANAGLIGPAARQWLLPTAALAAVFLADVSQHSRGEVERIWLPFVPWLALAAPGDRRGWLAAQVAVALVLQSAVVSPW